jgi:hypothetical protein
MSHGRATREFAEAIQRDWSKCHLCGGYGYRTFNCDDAECESRAYPHWHNEPCECGGS